MLDIFLDALSDSVKLIPFLLITYIVMEVLERSAGWKTQNAINKSGHIGPLVGGVLGVLPQCGFSAAASSLYSGRVIGIGTLVAVFFSTSDEMLPILISSQIALSRIFKILIVKVIIAVISGYIAQLLFGELFKDHSHDPDIHTVCEEEHCCCDHGVAHSAIMHTLKIFVYILVITFILNLAIDYLGEDRLISLFTAVPGASQIITALIGLIPNCASSVVITKMYLSGIITAGALMSGLLVNAGVGLLILLRLNRRPRENAAIIIFLYLMAVFWGIIIQSVGIVF